MQSPSETVSLACKAIPEGWVNGLYVEAGAALTFICHLFKSLDFTQPKVSRGYLEHTTQHKSPVCPPHRLLHMELESRNVQSYSWNNLIVSVMVDQKKKERDSTTMTGITKQRAKEADEDIWAINWMVGWQLATSGSAGFAWFLNYFSTGVFPKAHGNRNEKIHLFWWKVGNLCITVLCSMHFHKTFRGSFVYWLMLFSRDLYLFSFP